MKGAPSPLLFRKETIKVANEKARILVVEDDREWYNLLRIILQRGGYETRWARGSPEALQMIEQEQFNVVVLDIIMPPYCSDDDQDEGIELYKELIKRGLRRPVIFLSVRPSEEVKQRCLQMGASAYISKTPDERELLEAVRKAIKEGKKQPKRVDREAGLNG